jgi:hypothetical protein
VQCPAQHTGFTLQPNLNGLAWRSGVFFNRGEYQLHILSNRVMMPTETREQQCKSSEQDEKMEESASSPAQSLIVSEPNTAEL